MLSTERMDRILAIDQRDFVGEVEPGVITAEFQRQARSRSLFYPPDPASLENCTLGATSPPTPGGPAA